MMTRSRVVRALLILLVVLLALGLRARAAVLLPVDFDEDDYLRAGQQFATLIRMGDWAGFTQTNYRTEHPPLQKIAYGVAISRLPAVPEIPDRPTTAPPATDLPQPQLFVARMAAALFGTLEVLVLALLSPLAALMLAIHTWDIKYVSQVQLEALPALTSAVMVLAYLRSRRRWNRWLLLSAVALGLTAAGKYTYCIAAVAVAADWLWHEHVAATEHTLRAILRTVWPMGVWAVVSVLVFVAADPYLWPDPVGRLSASVFYHFGYAQSAGVKSAGYPIWQPLVWLFGPVPWHPGVFLVMLDLPITLLAAVGLPSLWRRQRLLALWLLIGFVFLLVWPTKWPQYILTITAPLSFAAAEGLRGPVRSTVRAWIGGLRKSRPRGLTNLEIRETKLALPWLVPGLVVLGIITLFPLVYQGAMSLTDFNALNIKDGLNGGVLREAFRGLTLQVSPVIVSVGNNGQVSTQVILADRGEPRQVPLDVAGMSTKDVHYAGPGFVWGLLSGIFTDVLVFEVIWTIFSLLLQAGLGIALAMILNRVGVIGRGFWRTLLIFPWAIPEFVGAMMWLRLFQPDVGWLAILIGHPIPWPNDPQMSLAVMLAASTWLGFPLMMLAATAGLRMIPADVFDAAAVDGVSRWQNFRYVTLPLLLPLLAPALIIRAIANFNQFYLFYVMGPNYPQITLSTISFYMFNISGGFGGQFAVSSAINIFTALVLLFFLFLLARQPRVAEGVTYA